MSPVVDAFRTSLLWASHVSSWQHSCPLKFVPSPRPSRPLLRAVQDTHDVDHVTVHV